MRKMILTMVGLMGAFGFSTAANADPVEHNGHWYELIDTEMTWTNAEQYAIDNYNNGHLVTINDAAEEDWLQATFDSDELYWIGFNDATIEGTWEWASGEAVSYTNWNLGSPAQPDNLSGKDYAVMNWGQLKAWNDEGNTYDFHYSDFLVFKIPNKHMSIVEFSREDVPEPATLGLLGLGLLGMGLIRRRKTV